MLKPFENDSGTLPGSSSVANLTPVVRLAGIPLTAIASPGVARLYRLGEGEPPEERLDLWDLAWLIRLTLTGILPSRPWPFTDSPGRRIGFPSFLRGEADAREVDLVITACNSAQGEVQLYVSFPDETDKPEPIKVCVVEDDPLMARCTALLLERSGWSVVTCSTAAQGLASIRANRPDLVLLNVDLPDQDGFSLCRQLKAESSTATIPVVICTGYTDLQEQARAVGAIGYLEKPRGLIGLPQRLRNLLQQPPAEALNNQPSK